MAGVTDGMCHGSISPFFSGEVPVSPQKPNLKDLDTNTKLLWAYRGVVALALLSTLLPWVTVSGSSSFRGADMQRDFSAVGLGGGMPQMSNQSVSGSVSVGGLSTVWGDLVLLVAIGGIVLSFIGPYTLLQDKDKMAMAGIGGVLLLLAVIMLMTAGGYAKGSANVQTQYGGASASAAVGFGVYLCLLASVATSALGFVVDWRAGSTAAQ
jgi:hypothetical protein